MELLRLHEAAQLVGVSYPTLKQWIYNGKIIEMRYDGLLAQVSIEIGGQTITSIIRSDAARDLDLKKGVSVYALVKATEAMVIRG